MRHGRRLVLLAALVWAGPLQAADCRLAAQRAEQEAGLPAGLLQAIGRVESGEWPWSVGEPGAGRRFETQEGAIEWVERRRAAGARSIDVGCFQVNLMYHPEAFASLPEAFDPDLNARVAASYLLALHARLPAWADAVAAYHSATPALGSAYRAQVAAWWRPSAPEPVFAVAAPVVAVSFGGLRFLPNSGPPPEGLPRILHGGADDESARLVRLPPHG